MTLGVSNSDVQLDKNGSNLGQGTPKAGKLSLLLIFLTVFIDLIGFGIIIPVLPTYAQALHASDMMVGLLIASYSLMQFLFMPFWGRVSDRVGRRPILLLSLCASFIGYLIWGFSATLPLLFLSRLVAGAGNANIAVAQAYVADVTTAENRAKGMGLIGAAFGLGFVLGPAIGGFCVGHGLQTIGFVAAGFSLVDLILTFFFLPEPPKLSHAGAERFSLDPNFYWKTISHKDLTLSLAIFLISTFAFANMEATIVLLTNQKFGFTPFQNSMMFTYIGVLICLVQGGMIHRLSKKYGEKKLIAVGTLLVAAGLLLTPATNNIFVLYGALFLLAIGSGINMPSNQSLLSKLAPADQLGGVMGIGQSLSTLGRIIGPAVGGAAFQYMGISSPYVIGALGMVLAFLLSLKLPQTETGQTPTTKSKTKQSETNKSKTGSVFS
jgi:MFS family permease